MTLHEHIASRALAATLRAQAATLVALADSLDSHEPTASPDDERLLTDAELRDRLGISAPTLRKLVRAGSVPFVHVGDVRRYRYSAVRTALDNAPRKTEAAPVRLSRGGK